MLAKEDVQFVRREKRADEAAQRKLEEQYGASRQSKAIRTAKESWKCTACGKLNDELDRYVCSYCVAVAPHVSRIQRRTTKGPTAASSSPSPSSLLSDVKLVPNSLDPEYRILSTAQGRCYRALVVDDDGDRSASRHQKQRRRRQKAKQQAKAAAVAVDGGVESDSEDDEPSCKFRMAKNIAGEDESDGEDEQQATAVRDGVVAHVLNEDDPAEHNDDDDPQHPMVLNTVTKEFVLHYEVAPEAASMRLSNDQLASLSQGQQVQVQLLRKTGGAAAAAGTPPPPSPCLTVVMRSKQKASLVTAKRRLEQYIQQHQTTTAQQQQQQQQPQGEPSPVTSAPAAAKPPVTVGYTHFFSLPLGTIPSVAAKVGPFLDELKQTLRASAASSGGGATDAERDAYVDALVQKVPKLHFTILMLSLPTPARLAEAMALMPRVEQLVRDAFPNPSDTPLVLRGLDVMNNDPTAVNVMYACLDPNTDGFHAFSKLIRSIGQLFLDAGLATPSEVGKSHKIHCTVCNTKWVMAQSKRREGGLSQWSRRQGFDARGAMEKYREVFLGSHTAQRVELNSLFGLNEQTRYYRAEAVVDMSSS